MENETGHWRDRVAPALEPSRAHEAGRDLIGSDALIVKCCVKSDERRVVLNVAAQKTSQRLRKWLHRVRGWR